jgi:DNA-binding MarR family transcriptional regulator
MNVTQKQICEDILELLGKLKNSLLEVAETQGITRIQLSALYCIGSRGELAMGKVADVLHCDPSNVTGLVDRLVTQGLVIREECPTDRRTKTLRLTEKGQQIITSAFDIMPERIGCSRLTAEERNTLHELILKVSATTPEKSVS